MQDSQFKPNWLVRPMRDADIDKCLVIWSRVELTEAYQTVSSCLAVDPEGFYVAELIESGEVVGMCAANLTDPGTAFVGFYGVEPEYQGIGIGRELWAKCMHRLEQANINIGLYGVPTMTQKYMKSGFKLEDSIRMVIYESERNEKLNLSGLKKINDLQTSDDVELRLIDSNTSQTTFQKIIRYDESVHHNNREKLLKIFLSNEQNDIPLTYAITRKGARTGSCESACCARKIKERNDSLSDNIENSLTISDSTSANEASGEEILGYGCIRRDNNQGGIIGPVYANSTDLCEIILAALIENFHLDSNRIFSCMALDSNKDSVELMERIGMKEIDQCTRMFTKSIPVADFKRVFYVHSPNFTIV